MQRNGNRYIVANSLHNLTLRPLKPPNSLKNGSIPAILKAGFWRAKTGVRTMSSLKDVKDRLRSPAKNLRFSAPLARDAETQGHETDGGNKNRNAFWPHKI